ncbi:MAG: cytochrome c peroxidase [Caldimonas sp.]
MARQSWASCHVAGRGPSPDNALAAQHGGPAADLQGARKTPGIPYLATSQPLFFAGDGTPTSGFFWDGRAGTLAEQASEPFLNRFEMANADKAAVVARLAAAAYADDSKKLFGAAIFSDVEGAFLRVSKRSLRALSRRLPFPTAKKDA